VADSPAASACRGSGPPISCCWRWRGGRVAGTLKGPGTSAASTKALNAVADATAPIRSCH